MGSRVGVVLCTCGGKLSSKIDFKALEQLARSLPGVEEVIVSHDFCKSPYAQSCKLKGRVDAVVFAGCSERSSLQFGEEKVEKLAVSLGLDPASWETVNLREQCFYIHDDPEGINAKAKDMLLMAYEKVKSNSVAFKERLKQKVLVVGGGVAGQRCAQALAELGVETVLVEEKPYLGGNAAKVALLWQSESTPSFCTSECVIPVVGRDTMAAEGLRVYLRTRVTGVTKEDGQFKVRFLQEPQKVDPNRCVACGKCAQACPVEIPNPFNLGKTKRKAIDKDFPLAVPDYYYLVDSACTDCGRCVEVCPTGAIDLSAKERTFEESFGAVVLATGFKSGELQLLKDLGYGQEGVLTLLEFERYLANGFFGKKPKEVTFVLCKKDQVGYCSRLCCLATVKAAVILAEKHPGVKVRVFYKSLRTAGRAFEDFRRRAAAAGVEFIQEPVEKVERKGDKLLVKAQSGSYESDLVVLAEPLVPSQVELTRMLDLQTDLYGFPIEFQPRVINPLESFVERVFVVGGAKGFKDVQESIESGLAAAVKVYKALKGLNKKYYSVIKEEKCSRCETCLLCCPHGAITLREKEGEKEPTVYIDPNLCRGCGLCYSACPSKAINFANLEDSQLVKMAEVAFKHLPEGRPRILAFLCYWCAYGAADLMGLKLKEKLPENFRSVRVRCSASVSLDAVAEILERDLADGVLIAGCPKENCHHKWGNYMQDSRVAALNETLQVLGVKDKVVRWEYIGVPQGKKLADAIREMNETLLKVKGESYV